jgi:hypothetical protein
MKSIDRAILRLLNKQTMLEYLREENIALKKAAFDNYHRKFLIKWLIGWGGVGAGALITFFVAALGFIPITPTEPSTIIGAGNSLIAPSITMNGLFITFTPVIAFFFLSELKEMKTASEIQTEKMKALIDIDDGEALVEFSKRVKYESAFFHNFRSGLIKYIGTYLTIAIGCLFVLFFGYLFFSATFFLLIAIFVLVALLLGVFPVVTSALSSTPLTLVTIYFPDGEKEIVTSVD